MWEIAYQGEPFYLEDLKGLSYIHHLLSRPRRHLASLELENATSGVSSAPAGSPDEQRGLEVTPDGTQAHPVIDSKTKAACEHRLKEIAELLPAVEQRRDEAEASKLRAERDEIRAYLKQSIGLHGKPRTFTDEGELARQRVQKNIKKAIECIAKRSLDLAELLDEHIKTGYKCEYSVDPRSEIPWELW
jgi:hypothetical protein